MVGARCAGRADDAPEQTPRAGAQGRRLHPWCAHLPSCARRVQATTPAPPPATVRSRNADGDASAQWRTRPAIARRHGFGRGPLAWLRRWAVVQPPCPHRPRCSARVFDGFAAPWRTALVDLTRAGYAAVPAIRRGPFETSGGEAEKSARLRGPAAALTYARSLAWGSLATMRASRGATQPKLHGRVQ